MRKRIDSTLSRLIRDGIASGQWRGHHMGPARFTGASTAESFCTECGRGVWANTHPAPNGIDIAGEAVALGCNRLMVAVKEIDAE